MQILRSVDIPGIHPDFSPAFEAVLFGGLLLLQTQGQMSCRLVLDGSRPRSSIKEWLLSSYDRIPNMIFRSYELNHARPRGKTR